jgi:hypothetical protein
MAQSLAADYSQRRSHWQQTTANGSVIDCILTGIFNGK